MIEIEFEEGRKTIEDYVCGECGGELLLAWGGSYGVEKHVVVCNKDREHHTFSRRKTAIQEVRKIIGPGATTTEIMRHVEPGELNRTMRLLAVRYPKAIVNSPTAALFVMDCMRLGLDPLVSPAEAVPIPFHEKGTGKSVVSMIITIDGWLSMASRGCPDKWSGAPSVEIVTDKAIAESLSGDPEAWVWMAKGRTNDMAPDQTSNAYGYLTQEEYQKAKRYDTPVAENPGNQARIRAIKRWVRENFPECRQRMMDITAEWIQRSQGIDEARSFIDAEYTITTPPVPKNLPKPAKTTPERKRTPVTASVAAKAPSENQPAEMQPVALDSISNLEHIAFSLKTLKWDEPKLAAYLQDRCKDKTITTVEDIPADLQEKIANELADWATMA